MLQANLASCPPNPSSTSSFENLLAVTKENKSKLLSTIWLPSPYLVLVSKSRSIKEGHVVHWAAPITPLKI